MTVHLVHYYMYIRRALRAKPPSALTNQLFQHLPCTHMCEGEALEAYIGSIYSTIYIRMYVAVCDADHSQSSNYISSTHVEDQPDHLQPAGGGIPTSGRWWCCRADSAPSRAHVVPVYEMLFALSSTTRIPTGQNDKSFRQDSCKVSKVHGHVDRCSASHWTTHYRSTMYSLPIYIIYMLASPHIAHVVPVYLWSLCPYIPTVRSVATYATRHSAPAPHTYTYTRVTILLRTWST